MEAHVTFLSSWRLFGADAAPAYLAQVRAAIAKLIAEHPDPDPEWSEK